MSPLVGPSPAVDSRPRSGAILFMIGKDWTGRCDGQILGWRLSNTELLKAPRAKVESLGLRVRFASVPRRHLVGAG